MQRSEVGERECDEVRADRPSGRGVDRSGLRDGEHDHAGGLGRCDAGRGVLDDEAFLRGGTEQRGGTQLALGGGLAVADVVTAHDDVERVADPPLATERPGEQWLIIF